MTRAKDRQSFLFKNVSGNCVWEYAVHSYIRLLTRTAVTKNKEAPIIAPYNFTNNHMATQCSSYRVWSFVNAANLLNPAIISVALHCHLFSIETQWHTGWYNGNTKICNYFLGDNHVFTQGLIQCLPLFTASSVPALESPEEDGCKKSNDSNTLLCWYWYLHDMVYLQQWLLQGSRYKYRFKLHTILCFWELVAEVRVFWRRVVTRGILLHTLSFLITWKNKIATPCSACKSVRKEIL